jgi:glycosyltransferase involved in cell wall biosynthesis
MLRQATLIIPSYNSENDLIDLLHSLSDWDDLPKEILVIDSSDIPPNISEELKFFFNDAGVIFKLISGKKMYPGHARNLGLMNTSYPIICFLDVRTHPSSDWFKSGFSKIAHSNLEVVWGLTTYSANTFFEKIVRACTFGELPIRTLPGSFVTKDVIQSTGLFISSTRAGEDADWMKRVSLHNFQYTLSTRPLHYSGLLKLKFSQLILKWFRNYFYGANLPYLSAHKDIYFYFSAMFLIILAFNWNTLSYDPLINGWNTNSVAYIPNVTKISILFLGSSYVAIRGIYAPIRKGIKVGFIIINLPAIISISLILDFVKSCAFFSARVLSFKSTFRK